MKRLSRNFLTICLVIALIVPSVFNLAIPRAHAQTDYESDAYGIGSGTVSSATGVLSCLGGGLIEGFLGLGASLVGSVVPVNDAAVTTNTGAIKNKDCVLDGLTTVIREVLISSMTRSIVNWINNGFNGSPAFVTDLEGFLLNVADEVVGTYIEGSEQLAFLCSPFNADVRIALALDYYSPFRDRAACTLTGVLQNISDAFGDFSTGQTWNAWFELSVNPYNNALGAYLGSRNALRTSIAQAQSEQLRILDWGRGVRSYEVCDTEGVEDPRNSANISVGSYNCRIATPGVVINEQLSQVVGSGFRQLELADEINEIIGALLGQLSRQILGGSEGGLYGLSRSNYGQPSYLDQLTQGSETNAQGEFRDYGVSIIEGAISTEQQYVSQKTISLERLNASETLLRSLEQCYVGKLSVSQNPPLTFEQRSIAQKGIGNATSTIAASITPLKTLIQSEITQAEDNISRLLVIKNHILEASSRVSVERIIATELDPLVETRTIHSQPDFVIALKQKEDLEQITESINQSTNANIEICKNFPIQPSQ